MSEEKKKNIFLAASARDGKREIQKRRMTKHTAPAEPELIDEADRSMKIQALRDMVLNAEKTIQGAKAMLLQLEGKKKSGRPRKSDLSAADGTVVEGIFDGQIMMGADGKQYPVPANYASKSKLVEGDMLKLTITTDGTFLYKQIGPVERRHAIGVITQDENGSYYVVADGKPYRILLASITYFKASPGDEVAVLLPRDIEATWAALENILQKGAHKDWQSDLAKAEDNHSAINSWRESLKEEAPTTAPAETPVISTPAETAPDTASDTDSVLGAWVRDMEAIEKEINGQK